MKLSADHWLCILILRLLDVRWQFSRRMRRPFSNNEYVVCVKKYHVIVVGGGVNMALLI
jgi:hypothetical protein